MISKNYIENTLDELDKLYINSSSKKKEIYYSKLAILELCGWIEASFDDMLIKFSNRRLTIAANKKFVEKEIVKRNNGFEYDINVRTMFMKVIGIKYLELIESKLEKTGKITVLRSTLLALKLSRNNAAHTFIKNSGNSYDTPSITKAKFLAIFPIIIKYDELIRKIKTVNNF